MNHFFWILRAANFSHSECLLTLPKIYSNITQKANELSGNKEKWKKFVELIYKKNNKKQKKCKRFHQNMENRMKMGNFVSFSPPREFIIKIIFYLRMAVKRKGNLRHFFSNILFTLFYLVRFVAYFFIFYTVLFSSTSRYCCTHIFELLDISIFYAHCTFSVWGLFYISFCCFCLSCTLLCCTPGQDSASVFKYFVVMALQRSEEEKNHFNKCETLKSSNVISFQTTSNLSLSCLKHP